MYCISPNPRKYNIGNLFELATRIMFNGWSLQSVMVAIKGSKEPCNALTVLGEILDAAKTYSVGGQSIKGEFVLSKVENYLAKLNGKLKACPVISEGRHRALAHVIAAAFKPDLAITPNITFVEGKDAAAIALEGNGDHDFISRLQNLEKLNEVVALVKAGVYKKEGDLPFKRGVNQKIWAQATLVCVHDISVDKAVQLDKESARYACDGKTAAKESVGVAAAVEAAIGGKVNVAKVLSGDKLRKIRDMAQSANAKHPVTKLLEALCDDAEITATKAVMDLLKA